MLVPLLGRRPAVGFPLLRHAPASACAVGAAELTTTALLTAADAMAATDTSLLDALGRDILIFLAASVVVTPAARVLKLSPVLLYLAVGCAIGPHGFELFSNNEADLELGDFGILFLLFVEGLNLSPERLKELGAFFKLGASQLLLSISFFFFATLLAGPLALPFVEALGVPLDDALIAPIVNSPVEAFCVAAAGALSSSAFVLSMSRPPSLPSPMMT